MASSRGRAGRALLCLLLTVGACSNGGDGPKATSSSTSAPSPGEGTLRVGIGGSLVVDPVEVSLAAPSDLMVIDLLHDGLTRLDADGAAQPALASEWEANGSSTAFRFRLDPDATFTDERAVTPEDVIASLERVMAAGESSLVALSLEAVTGFEAFAQGEADHVSGLTAPDAHTVRVALDVPLSVLPEVLSNPALSVVDSAAIDDDSTDLADLALSGAWQIASAEGDVVRLQHRPAAPGDLETIELHSFADADAAYVAFDDEEVDWAQVPSTRYGQAVDDHGADAFAPFHAELFFGLNTASAALGDEAFREAIVAAIDRDAIVEAVYPDLADPLATLVPAGVVGHDPDRCSICAYDADGARQAVTDAYPDGDVPTVRIDFDESDPQEAMAEQVAADLEAAGIPTELRPKPRDEYERFVVSGDQELFSFGWIGAYGSPDAYLAPLFGSAANDNLTGFRSARVDGLLERARSAADGATSAERWAVAEAAVLEAAVVVPIAQFRTQVVVAERVEGLAHAADGTVDWSQVRLTG